MERTLSTQDPYEYDDPFSEPEPSADDEHADFSEPIDSHDVADPGPYAPPPLPRPTPTHQPPLPGMPIMATNVQCSVCGYNLTGVAIGSNCPECGSSVDNSLYAASAGPPMGKAITALVLGICSIPTCCCPPVSGILAVIGLIFAILALNEIPQGSPGGARGMAMAGLICSIVGLVLTVGYFGVYLIGNF